MNYGMKKIAPEALVPMDIFTEDFPLRIDLAYCKPAPENIFGVIYRPQARLWLYKPLAKIVLLAAACSLKNHNLQIVLYDGLRTVEAQKRMQKSPIVQKNPGWLEGPTRLLSPPGAGAHPRGMAIDLSLETAEGKKIDMGTEFDYLAAKPDAASNPAHRDYAALSGEIKNNRKKLEAAMQTASNALKLPLLALPQEWWDFRLPEKIYGEYAPLSDADLPVQMRMTDDFMDIAEPEDFPDAHFESLKNEIYAEIDPALATILTAAS
ncbi:MAG TPA: D-Ala-D-Ala dipeptidase [Rhodospirillaceae bacterium]|nr:D-Ala-D-Ala dipeptidase [Rhodospirillaceae bacterium]